MKQRPSGSSHTAWGNNKARVKKNRLLQGQGQGQGMIKVNAALWMWQNVDKYADGS